LTRTGSWAKRPAATQHIVLDFIALWVEVWSGQRRWKTSIAFERHFLTATCDRLHRNIKIPVTARTIGFLGRTMEPGNQGRDTVSIPPKITNEALEAYCYCAQKFYLKLQGARGTKTDYELMRAQLRCRTKINEKNRFSGAKVPATLVP